MWGIPDGTESKEKRNPLDEALPVATPPTWDGRIARVEWILRNTTPGEQAYLYRLLHESEGLRLDRCRYVERKEQAAIAAKM